MFKQNFTQHYRKHCLKLARGYSACCEWTFHKNWRIVYGRTAIHRRGSSLRQTNLDYKVVYKNEITTEHFTLIDPLTSVIRTGCYQSPSQKASSVFQFKNVLY